MVSSGRLVDVWRKEGGDIERERGSMVWSGVAWWYILRRVAVRLVRGRGTESRSNGV
jgi:hypothetical protein